jgi:hypothetical protein
MGGIISAISVFLLAAYVLLCSLAQSACVTQGPLVETDPPLQATATISLDSTYIPVEVHEDQEHLVNSTGTVSLVAYGPGHGETYRVDLSIASEHGYTATVEPESLIFDSGSETKPFNWSVMLPGLTEDVSDLITVSGRLVMIPGLSYSMEDATATVEVSVDHGSTEGDGAGEGEGSESSEEAGSGESVSFVAVAAVAAAVVAVVVVLVYRRREG